MLILVYNIFMFVFVCTCPGEFLYTLKSRGLERDPQYITDVFQGLDSDIDDAVYAPNRKTYFFKVNNLDFFS